MTRTTYQRLVPGLAFLVAWGWSWITPIEMAVAAETTPVLVGRVSRVVDGDTIRVSLQTGEIVVRLDSIDAPERHQAWGDEAKGALGRKIEGQDVSVEVVSQDRYERLIGTIYLGEENINAWMVRGGHAWTYRFYASDPLLCVWEANAREDGEGLWRTSLAPQVAPWEWRRGVREGSRERTDYSAESVDDCVRALKGGAR